MSKIKFRAFIKSTKEIVDVEWIDFINKQITYHRIDFKDFGLVSSASFEEIELMQYTNLNDRNGKEIYEGDIADVYYMDFIKYRAQIIFGEYEQDGSGGEYSTTECMGFYAKALNPDELDSDGIRIIPDYCKETSILALSSIEIIGNIYEDKHLLECDAG
ncbi:YopX family protein [Lysinibacillus halotolerans]